MSGLGGKERLQHRRSLVGMNNPLSLSSLLFYFLVKLTRLEVMSIDMEGCSRGLQSQKPDVNG